MNKIRVMDETLANKIAAGEVVEKCSSIIKAGTKEEILECLNDASLITIIYQNVYQLSYNLDDV